MNSDPERAWTDAVSHWKRCSICCTAGGEWANPEDLCATGRQLGENWRKAEESEMRRMEEAEKCANSATTTNGEYQGCVDCSRLICFDVDPDPVDVLDRAYVTESGDLYCTRCGRKYDEAEREQQEQEYDGFEDPNEASCEGPLPEDTEEIGR